MNIPRRRINTESGAVKIFFENNFTKKKKRCCKNLPMWYSLIMENEMTLTNPKEMAADDLAAYASEYEAWMDEIETLVKEHGNPNIWVD